MSDDYMGQKYELSEEDIQKLIKSPFEKKIDITKKIADYYQKGGFDQQQMLIAARIFGTLVKDAEVNVRKTLAEAIKDHPDVPREVILSLANDVHEVSLPVLEFSEVLTDADLIEIVTSSEDAEKQKSISKRQNVSESVSGALIETNNEDVVGTLLENNSANLSEKSYDKIVKDFGDRENIMEAMIERETLPVSIVENLTNKISETIYKKLQEKHKDAFVRMDEVIKKSKEMATMKVIGLRSTDSEYYHFCKLMEKLKIQDDLSPIYALCMGNMNIFEVKIARLTQTPVLNIRMLIQDNSNKGFRVLYKRANLPKDLFEATEILITALRELDNEHKNEANDPDVTRKIVGELAACITKKVKYIEDIKNLDYILSLVSHYSSMDDNILPSS